VDPAELFPILTEATVVAHNAPFDLGFLSSLGLEPGKVADTMILSQLLHAGAKVEPLKRGANLPQPRLRSKARARARA
jgi:DNA polymerase III epsilon subunit-like protein